MASAPRKTSQFLRLFGLNLAIVAVYVGGKMLGKAPISGGFSPVWPPTGIALAALVLFGKEAIPGVALGCLSSIATSGLPLATSLGIGLGNLAEAGLGAWILQTFGFRPTLARRRDVLLLAIPAAILGALVGASVGCASFALLPPHDWGKAFVGWWSWCMEDLLGVLVVAPPVLTLASRQRAGDLLPRRKGLETALLLITVALLGFLVFGGALGDAALQFSLTYALFPLVLIAADRHGPQGASLATFLTAAAALTAGHLGRGPLSRAEGREYIILLAGFLALLALTSLLLAAAGSERRERAVELRGQLRLMEMATESIGMAGLGGRLLRLNIAGRQLFGLPPGRNLADLRVVHLVAPEDRARFQETILPQVLRRGSWSGDISVLNLETGESIPTRHFLFRIDNPLDGSAEAFGSIGHDLREARRSEAALRQTQRLEGLGLLAGGIAHDYNNLLTALLGHLDLAKEMVDAEAPASRHLDAVALLAERSGALTRQLLAYAGKGGAEHGPVSLQALIRDMAELMHTSLSRKADLVVSLPDSPALIAGDRVQIEQVVMNLLVNASEALGDRGGTIRLSLRETAVTTEEAARRFPGFDLAPGPCVELTLSDDGMGMGPEVLDRIFDPFFTTKSEGRGLGLSAIRGILQAHGGAVEVQSEPGRGTTFKVVFPPAG